MKNDYFSNNYTAGFSTDENHILRALSNLFDNALVRPINRFNVALDIVARTREYKNNFSMKNEDLLENIEKGYIPIALIGSELFGLDLNYQGKEHGKNALMLSVAGNSNLLLNIILENQSDLSKPRLNFSKIDKEGNDAFIHAVKSGNIDNCNFMLAYPELLFQTISKRYFSGVNKELLTPEVKHKIQDAIKNTYMIDMRHKNNERMSALAYARQSPNEKLYQLINAVSKVDVWQMEDQQITKIDTPNRAISSMLKRFVQIIADTVVRNVSQNSEFWENKIEKTGKTSQYILGLYRIYRDRDEIFLKSFRNDTIEKNLLAGPADINYSSKIDGKTALMIAAETKSQSRLNWIISTSFLRSIELDTKKQDLGGNTALMFAAANDNVYAAKKIIQYKTVFLKWLKTKFSSIKGINDLFEKQESKILQNDFKSLISHTDNSGKTALMIAAENDNTKIMEIIINKAKMLRVGIDLTYQDNNGENILTLAVNNGSLKAVDLIFRDGPYNYLANAANGKGKRPIEIAIEKNDIRMVDLLIKNNARIKVLTKEGKNMMDIAILNNCIGGIRKLLKNNGLVPTQKNSQNRLSCQYSQRSPSKEMDREFHARFS